MAEFIDFIELDNTKGITKQFTIQPKNSSDINESLGLIKWYSPWRRYCFHPANQTIFDSKCLSNINDFISSLMNERKKDNG